MVRNRDSIRDHFVADEPPDDSADAVANEPADLQLLVTQLAKNVLAMSGVSANQVAHREALEKREREDVDRNERNKAWCGLSAQERTQQAADAKWQRREGDERYRVNHWTGVVKGSRHVQDSSKYVKDEKAFPTIDIWGSDPVEAESRYRIICGIRSTEFEIRAVPVEGHLIGVA